MEWFALAVDSIILVAGLIYYLIKYIHDHTSTKTSKYLKDVSNTGNIFLKNLIKKFSNKNTIFIGIAFLLTIHLLVDIGVYLVPYSIGTENTLYFNNIDDSNQKSHLPIFNFINFEKSNFSIDYSNLKNEPFIIFIIIIFYLLSLFFFFYLMFMPFYIFYKNFNNKKIEIKKVFAILFLSSLILLILFLSISKFTPPISIGMYSSSSLYGVDIYTTPITDNFNLENFDNLIFTILSLFLIYIIIVGFLLFRYTKYEYYFNKIIYISILFFFISYITIFYISTINLELQNLNSKFLNKNNVEINNENFNVLKQIYFSQSTIKLKNYIITKTNNYNFIASPFSIINLKDNSHQDYIYINFSNLNLNNKYNFKKDNNKIILSENIYEFNENKILKNQFELFLKIGENKFNIENNRIKITTKKQFKQYTDNIININKIGNTPVQDLLKNLIQYLRVILVSIFYIFGTIHFSIYYFKMNILK